MYNEDYISYINSLHNYNAQNSNSYGEMNVNNHFFKDIMVEVGLSKYIIKKLEEDNPHTIILTGHAGDGKTSIMYQVLAELGITFDSDVKIQNYNLPSGKICRCIKDFSEIADEEKKNVLEEALNMPLKGNYTFMVANTGPLINTFGELFDELKDSEDAKIKLIDYMDKNTGEVIVIKDKKICVINIAKIDNTYFVTEFVEKIIQDKLWVNCENCPKNKYCHILKNRNLIKINKNKIYEFLNMHYSWLNEYGKRLTIRSMIEQVTYMITGGFNCAEVRPIEIYKYLFSNLFFGYIGTIKNPKALNILAIKETIDCGYDNKRLCADERLLLNYEFETIFEKEMAKILKDAEIKNAYLSGWIELLRRAYLFTNIETNEETISQNYEDLFSKQFKKFLQLRNGEIMPSRLDANLICDALSMIYIGTISNDSTIPLTLSRESGLAQNVQLVTGTLMTRDIKVVTEPTKYSLFNNKRNSLKIKIGKNELQEEITLPLLNYFEELKNGIISTNIDPQLSYGIENLKADLSELMDNDEVFEMVILKNSGTKHIRLEITDEGKIREV